MSRNVQPIPMDRELVRKLKIMAAQRGQTIRELAETAIRGAFFAPKIARNGLATLSPVPAAVAGMGLKDKHHLNHPDESRLPGGAVAGITDARTGTDMQGPD